VDLVLLADTLVDLFPLADSLVDLFPLADSLARHLRLPAAIQALLPSTPDPPRVLEVMEAMEDSQALIIVTHTSPLRALRPLSSSRKKYFFDGLTIKSSFAQEADFF